MLYLALTFISPEATTSKHQPQANFLYLRFMGPCIVNAFLSITNKIQHCIVLFIIGNTLRISSGFSAQHQELKSVHAASDICQNCLHNVHSYMFRQICVVRVAFYWRYLIILWLFHLGLPCTVFVLTCFLMSGCFGNMYTCIYCFLYCFFYVYLFLFVLSVPV